MRSNRLLKSIIISTIALIIGIYLAITLGVQTSTFQDVLNSIFNYDDSILHITLRDVRLPRVIAVFMVGGILGSTGIMMQAITKNPIAEPSLLGINQGATLLIAIFFALGISVSTINVLIASFIGAMISGLLVLALLLNNKENSIVKILLAGTSISTFFLSLTTIIGLLSNQSQLLAFWTSGGFRNTTWLDSIVTVIFGMMALILGLLISSKLNVLNLGDDVAIGLGVDPQKLRLQTFAIIIPALAAAVAVGKNIAFVGLIVSQISRKIFKENYTVNILMSFIFGAILLTYADIFARLVYSPYEVPIGIFTALIGTPFFIILARRESR